MTLEEKVGQMFAVGFEGTSFSETCLDELIAKHKFGNFIHFSRNAHAHDGLYTAEESMAATRALNEETVQCSQAHLGQRPFIMVDEEGGYVTQVFSKTQQYPGARACTQGATLEETQRLACALARKCAQWVLRLTLRPLLM